MKRSVVVRFLVDDETERNQIMPVLTPWMTLFKKMTCYIVGHDWAYKRQKRGRFVKRIDRVCMVCGKCVGIWHE